MYKASIGGKKKSSSKGFNKKGTRAHPDHPLTQTARILVLHGRHPNPRYTSFGESANDPGDESD